MNKKQNIIMFLLVILTIGIVFFLANSILSKTGKMENYNNITNTMLENNTIYNNIYNQTENNLIVNQAEVNQIVENSIINNTTVENTVQKPFSSNSDYDDNKQKALELVQNDWGRDSSVYFYVDEDRGNGKYIISVRDKSTTSAVVWYNVDVNNNTAKMQ